MAYDGMKNRSSMSNSATSSHEKEELLQRSRLCRECLDVVSETTAAVEEERELYRQQQQKQQLSSLLQTGLTLGHDPTSMPSTLDMHLSANSTSVESATGLPTAVPSSTDGHDGWTTSDPWLLSSSMFSPLI